MDEWMDEVKRYARVFLSPLKKTANWRPSESPNQEQAALIAISGTSEITTYRGYTVGGHIE